MSWAACGRPESLERTFHNDLALQSASGRPGGHRKVELVHYAIDGLILDRLTVSIGAGSDSDDVVARIVGRVTPG